jgi:hypothetical protein
MKLEKFLEAHSACAPGAKWALATGCTKIEEVWLRDDLTFDWRIWIAVRVLDSRTLVKFACACVREIWHILPDDRSRKAVEIAEQYAAGNCSAENLAAASAAASEAAWSARAAAESDQSDAAWAAAWAASAAASAAATPHAKSASAAAYDARTAARAAAENAAASAAAAYVASGDARAARVAAGAAAVKKQNAILLALAPTITV